ncbi:MAG: hypothetical protein ACR2NZ_11395 [Rubripirellula sp.]
MMSATVTYNHTQRGMFLRFWLGGLFAVFACLSVTMFVNEEPWTAALFVGVTALLGGLALVFRSLNVQVTSELVCVSFGAGMINKSILLDDIADLSIVQTRWYHGWGIKWYGRGFLYNIAGFDAVQIELRNGRQCRVGTDEPQALRDAIARACRFS